MLLLTRSNCNNTACSVCTMHSDVLLTHHLASSSHTFCEVGMLRIRKQTWSSCNLTSAWVQRGPGPPLLDSEHIPEPEPYGASDTTWERDVDRVPRPSLIHIHSFLKCKCLYVCRLEFRSENAATQCNGYARMLPLAHPTLTAPTNEAK